MNLDWIKVLPSKETPFNKEFFKKLSTSILDYAFPIGKTEIFYDTDDHSDYLGFTWERTCIGRVPVGINSDDTDFNTIGKTGGEKEHKLTVNEMPSHTHGLYGGYDDGTTSSTDGYLFTKDTAGSQGWKNFDTYGTSQIGGSQSHNNLQPYQVVAFWKRVE